MNRADELPRTVSDAVPRRFTAGDALRGVAAMFVLVFHAAVETMLFKHTPGFVLGSDSPHSFSPICGRLAPEFIAMRFGVFIFFALSGYLLTRTFLAAFTLGTPRPSISRYARNRALRIIPAFWVVTTVFVVWDHVAGPSGVGGLLATYGFAQNYHWSAAAEVMRHAWTLDIEAAFYVAIPLASLLALAAGARILERPRSRLAIVLAVLLAAYVLSLLAKHSAGNPLNNAYNLAEFLFAFIPGIALVAVEPFAAPRGTPAATHRHSRGHCHVRAAARARHGHHPDRRRPALANRRATGAAAALAVAPGGVRADGCCGGVGEFRTRRACPARFELATSRSGGAGFVGRNPPPALEFRPFRR